MYQRMLRYVHQLFANFVRLLFVAGQVASRVFRDVKKVLIRLVRENNETKQAETLLIQHCKCDLSYYI